VLEHKRSALGNVALETSPVLTEQFGPAANDFLRQTRAAAFDCATNVRVMAIGAAHFSFKDGMMMR
jgi:hypothetical protein